MRDERATGRRADYDRALSLAERVAGKLYRAAVRPRWIDARTFWYRVETGPGTSEIVRIDCETGARTLLARAPEVPLPNLAEPKATERTGAETEIVFVNGTAGEVDVFWLDHAGAERPYGRLGAGEERRQHTYAGHRWAVRDGATLLGVFEAEEAPLVAFVRAAANVAAPQNDGPRAIVRDGDIYMAGGEGEFRLTHDGRPDDGYEGCGLSPDGSKLFALKVERPEERRIHLFESVPGESEARVRTVPYAKPGDPIARARPRLFDLVRRREVPIDEALFPNPFALSHVRWDADGRRVTFVYNERGHRRLALFAVDAASGAAKVLVEEQSPTFVDYAHKLSCTWVDGANEFVWMSERDGYNHLYLFDGETGALKRQLTNGPFVVRAVEHLDADRREVWFYAGGVRPREDPYHLHLCRVSLDGGSLSVLTEGDGTHSVAFSPDRRFFIDTYSRADLPPIVELRHAADGALVAELERADASALFEAGWTLPERVVAKGRDGETEVHGLVIVPSRLDAEARFPIIEEIYAGPQDQHVPKAFSLLLRQHALAELGFVVVMVDGMGTNWRSKAFQDVAYQNLEDAGLADRRRFIETAAASRPYMDLTRVGIYGGSAGGQNAVRALIDHHDFYRVAVADCGCHDNRMDKLWWNELFLGWPVGPAYAAASNVEAAGRLEGKLMLIVGELDDNVDPVATFALAAALSRADKDFDLVVVPGTGHGAAESAYGSRRRMDFFVRHLLGFEPRRT